MPCLGLHLFSGLDHPCNIARFHHPSGIAQLERTLRMRSIAHPNEHNGGLGEKQLVDRLNIVESFIIDANDRRIATVILHLLCKSLPPTTGCERSAIRRSIVYISAGRTCIHIEIFDIDPYRTAIEQVNQRIALHLRGAIGIVIGSDQEHFCARFSLDHVSCKLLRAAGLGI